MTMCSCHRIKALDTLVKERNSPLLEKQEETSQSVSQMIDFQMYIIGAKDCIEGKKENEAVYSQGYR